MECLDTETLCMYMDNELDRHTRAMVEAQLRTCPSCAKRLQSLQAHDALRRDAWLSSPSHWAQPCDGSNPTQLSAYASQQLPPEEHAQVEQHLHTCAACVQDVMAIRSTMRLLRQEPLLTPPAYLVEAVQREVAAIPVPAVTPAAMIEKLGTLMIAVARSGLTFVESLHLPAHIRLAVDGQLLPAGAFRSAAADTEAAAFINIRQTGGALDLHMQVLHENSETVLLHLRLQKQGLPLARKRVALASDGRTRSSNTTSANGEVTFPRLSPGEYTVRIPQENVETGLILRPL